LLLRDDLFEPVTLEAVAGSRIPPKAFRAHSAAEIEVFAGNANATQAFPRAKRVTSRRGLLDEPAMHEAREPARPELRSPFSLGYPGRQGDDDDDVGKSKARVRLERQRKLAAEAMAEGGGEGGVEGGRDGDGDDSRYPKLKRDWSSGLLLRKVGDDKRDARKKAGKYPNKHQREHAFNIITHQGQ